MVTRFWLGLPGRAYGACGAWYAVEFTENAVKLRALWDSVELRASEHGVICFLLEDDWALYHPKGDKYWYLASRTNPVLMAFTQNGNDLWPVSGDIRPKSEEWLKVPALIKEKVPVEYVRE